MYRKIIGLFFICLVSQSLIAQIKLSKSDIVKLDFKTIAQKKKRIQAKDPELYPAYLQLLNDADKLLNYLPVSVMGKTDIPPSGDKHDYMSLAPYWWPNPATSNGLPYIRKDGEINPEVKNYPDKEHMPVLCEHINLLALAYYFSQDEKYAKHASKLIQVWFLDPATKMNPNLKYGQAVKGVVEGRAEGLIDTRQFIFVIDGIDLIKTSKYWTSQNQKEMKVWFSAFLNWLQTSDIGKDEMNAQNNHGVWYDAQALAIALYVDSTELANKIVQRTANRLDMQQDAKGFFPLELARTTSFHYSVFILNAFNVIAQLSEKTSINLWQIKTRSGKSLNKAFDAMMPYLIKKKEWDGGQQIRPFSFPDGYPILLSARTKYHCEPCFDFIKSDAKQQYKTLLLNLL
ncbi:MAG: hypothetical protein D4R41_02090 [Sediminibacterium sp.]|jgi:hypothetical protein|nr:MAG: hypothetical protein D4R41_02090 [Sediminibacterium sp.]